MNNKITQLERRLKDLEQEVDRLRQQRVSQTGIIPDQIKMRHIAEGVRYLRSGVAADRPTAGETPLQGSPVYFATDTGILSLWNGNEWIEDSAGLTNYALQQNGVVTSFVGAGMEAGWGIFSLGATANKTATITLQGIYTQPPLCFANFSGDDSAGGTAYSDGANSDKGAVTIKTVDRTTTTFVVQAHTADGTSWGALTTVFFTWHTLSQG